MRAQLSGLISELGGGDLRPMSLGLSHSLSRYKLKFSPEKVDTMIVQVRQHRMAARTATADGLAGCATWVVDWIEL